MTKLELVLVTLVVLFGVFFLLDILVFGKNTSIKARLCAENRRLIETAELSYFTENWTHSSSFEDLISEEYLEKMPTCPSGGTFSWMSFPKESPLFRSIIVCSYHKPLDDINAPQPVNRKTDLNIDSLEEGWYFIKPLFDINKEDLSLFEDVSDIMILNTAGTWITYQKKDDKFTGLSGIPANTDIWIYKQGRKNK